MQRTPRPPLSEPTIGLLYSLAAFFLWGLFPVYLKSLASVPALEILSHRIVWSVALVALIIALRRRWAGLLPEMRNLRRIGVFMATTMLVSVNWLIFIWAVNDDRLLEASLGYFINPLVNVLLAVLFLRERLNGRQWGAIALVGVGVANLVLGVGQIPWVSLSLAFSFGLYMLIRKRVGIDPLLGLLIETALLAPFALGYLLWLGPDGAFGADVSITIRLVVTGAFTALPLIWIAHGAKRLKLSTVGLMQYMTPTAQFLLAIWLYGEPFSATHIVTFGLIWSALALYSYDAFWGRRPTVGAAAE